VTGKVAPDTLKPVPVIVAALTVTAAVPVELSVTVSVEAVFTTTFPNATLVALMLNVGTTAFNCSAKLLETPPALAVSVAACAAVTEDTVAVNPALVALAGTVTVAGTLTAALVLARLTLTPPLGAAALSVTVQLSLPAPVIDALLQVSPLNAAGTTAFSCKAKVLETPPALAVNVTACADVTDDTLAVKPALVAFAGTVTVAGTLTAALLLARLTLKPPLAAAAVSVTVQLSLPDPVMDALLQVSPLNAAVADVPVPLRLIAAVPLVEELLWMVSCPVAAPVAVGSNCTSSVTV